MNNFIESISYMRLYVYMLKQRYLILGLISTWRWKLLLSLRCVDGNWTNFLIGNLNMHLFVRLFISWCLLLEVDSSSFLIYAGVLYLNLTAGVLYCYLLLFFGCCWLCFVLLFSGSCVQFPGSCLQFSGSCLQFSPVFYAVLCCCLNLVPFWLYSY